jgi:N-acetylglutamate synthase-like GNAT family acetyltransferase
VKIKRAISVEERCELDQLLWDILWRPLNLGRNIRNSFKLDKPQIDLIALDHDVMVGGLIANWLSGNEVELRHIAVRPEYQRRSVGRLLVRRLVNLIQGGAPLRIQTYARNTSTDFFVKLGFKPEGHYLRHEDFYQARHRVSTDAP